MIAVAHARGVLTVTAVFFVALTLFVGVAGSVPGDVAVRDAILRAASPPVVGVMHVVNRGGEWRVLLPATLLLLAFFARARARWWLWVALMIVAAAAPDVIKAVVERPRPEALSWGFPSGHSAAAAAFFGAVIYLSGSLRPLPCRVVRIGAVLAILLVGIARVVLRAHWPSDVAGGIAFGLALASCAAWVDGIASAVPRIERAIVDGRRPRA